MKNFDENNPVYKLAQIISDTRHSPEETSRLAHIFVGLPVDEALLLWRGLGSNQKTSGHNIAKLHDAKVNGRKVQDYIVDILSGGTPQQRTEQALKDLEEYSRK